MLLGSAVLFGVLHISNHGWVLTDFFVYMGGGLIFAVLFRVTKSIYWPYWTAHSLQWHWSNFTVAVILGAQQYRSILGEKFPFEFKKELR